MSDIATSEHRPHASLVRRLLPSLAVLVLLPLCVAVALLWRQHQQRMGELIAEDANEMATDLAMILDLQAVGLATALEPLAADLSIQRALSEASSEGLLAAAQPVFTAMQREHRISHLYFHDPSRICLLRVHAPEQHGDRIDRHSLQEAGRTGRTACGLEFGPRGTFTLRAVQPIFTHGRLIGYVELGKEVVDAMSTLRAHLDDGNQMAIIGQKVRLNRPAWEATQRQLGREADWDRLRDHVVVFTSQGHLPDAIAAWVDTPTNLLVPRQGETEVLCDGKLWRIVPTPLRDAAGARIGDLLAMRDISGERTQLQWQLILGSSIGLLLLALVLAFVQRLLAAADRRVRAQQASLRDERWRLGSIIEATRAGTWEWHVGTGSVQVSERWAQILGYTCLDLGAMDRQRWELLFHADDLPVARDLMERHFSKALPFFDHVCRLKHRDGHWVWIHCRGRVFTRTRSGGPLLMFGTHSDITARKQAEEEHLKLQQQKMARELGEMMHANRLVALGTLMAGLAHEFNHPAQVVLMNQKSLRGMVEACAAAAKDLQGPAVGLLTWAEVATIAPQLLDDMELATTQLSELIENVQNYAKPSEGQRKTIDYAGLTAVARSSLRLVASYARRCQVALINEVEPAGGGHTGNNSGGNSGSSSLQQIVVNLLINAIQASQPGDSVTLACRRHDGQLCLTVSDSGSGVDAAVLEKLGQPFISTKKAQGGNGLGLFICMQLVAEQGGSLELTPRAPRGTLVRVVYPDAAPT